MDVFNTIISEGGNEEISGVFVEHKDVSKNKRNFSSFFSSSSNRRRATKREETTEDIDDIPLGERLALVDYAYEVGD